MVGIRLIIFGVGYSGTAIAEQAVDAGLQVTMVSRRLDPAVPSGITLVGFDAAEAAIATATHLVTTAAPDEHGDPVLARWRSAIERAPLRWIGYLSTTGVYGNRNGGWVDEGTPPAPTSERGMRRVAAELAWSLAGRRCAVDLFRLAGIYGPGRSAMDDLRVGAARRVSKPGHLFGRIHRDDIAGAVLAATRQTLPTAVRVLNLADDEPAANAEIVAEAARLLGMAPPPIIAFEQALASMSPMARSFWADDRKVSSAATQQALGRRWLYPTYREGLQAILGQSQQDRSQ